MPRVDPRGRAARGDAKVAPPAQAPAPRAATVLVFGGGLGGPLRGLPQNEVARAKPALERGYSDAVLVSSAQSCSTTIPATVTPAPTSAPRDSRSPKQTRASGIANIGAVDDSTAATATPAYLTLATNITELSAVTTPSTASRARAAPPIRPRPAERAHGVAHSTIAARGNRIACAVTASISRSGGLTRTTETAQASDASVAAPTPNQNRSSGARSAHGATMRTMPPRVRRAPAATASVTGSPRNAAARAAAPRG